MPRLLERLFGPAKPRRDYAEGPKLAGLDAVSEAAIALQKRYWRDDPDERAELEARLGEAPTGIGGPEGEASWAARLRLHHLRCLALLDAEDLLLRRALLAPEAERPSPAQVEAAEAELAPLRAAVAASAKLLLARRSPYRPRHGFAWLGAGPPEGEDIPYSDFQGRCLDASLSHLGSLEYLRLDGDSLEPVALEFLAFDELMTLSFAPREGGDAVDQPPFRPARILREYGREDILALVPLRAGLSWFGHEPELLRGAGERGVSPIELAGLADPAKRASHARHDRRALELRAGLTRLQILSDYAEDGDEGLCSFTLASAYQLSLAIDQDDPRFAAKCQGRGLDPAATRGDVVNESRLRASARAARKD